MVIVTDLLHYSPSLADMYPAKWGYRGLATWFIALT